MAAPRTAVERTRPAFVSLDEHARLLDSSPRGQAIVRTLAAPISLGYSLLEVAQELGISKHSASQLLNELRDELEAIRCRAGRFLRWAPR